MKTRESIERILLARGMRREERESLIGDLLEVFAQEREEAKREVVEFIRERVTQQAKTGSNLVDIEEGKVAALYLHAVVEILDAALNERTD